RRESPCRKQGEILAFGPASHWPYTSRRGCKGHQAFATKKRSVWPLHFSPTGTAARRTYRRTHKEPALGSGSQTWRAHVDGAHPCRANIVATLRHRQTTTLKNQENRPSKSFLSACWNLPYALL